MYIPISGLPAAAALDGTEQIPMVQAGATVRAPSAALVGPIRPPNGHVVSGGGVPSAVYSAGDGGALGFIGGTDSAGGLLFNSGTGFGIPTVIVTVTFAAPWNAVPVVIVGAGNQVSAVSAWWWDSFVATFRLWLPSAPPLTNYAFFWHAIGAPN